VRKGAIVGVLTLAVFLTLGAGQALATTTHPFLGYITTASGGNVQPEAVDSEGNLIVLEAAQHTVAKFDPSGNPVSFSGLGTNEIDGKGGLNCPSTLSDCDRVPTNGFGAGTGSEQERFVAVDQSNGPASGYIYVANDSEEPECQSCSPTGEIDVFNSSGVYKGTVDERQAGPDVAGNRSSVIWVDSEGVLYIVHWNFGGESHIDRYVPIDGNPAHDQFSGQARVKNGAYYGVAASPAYAYVFGRDFEHPAAYYLRYRPAEFHHKASGEYSIPDEFPPEPAIFGPTFGFGPGNTPLPAVYVDETPEEHVYIGGGCCGSGIIEFDSENHQIGPEFGGEHIGGVQAFAIDRSGGPNEGKIYAHGLVTNRIAVFGPPAPIPDINDIQAEASHASAQLTAEINLGGGPPATECVVEYGTTINVYGEYEHTVPCAPPTPYGANTSMSLNLNNLAVEGHYHYRISVSNEDGRNVSADHQFTPHAVLGVSTDPATSLTRTNATLNGSLNPDGLETHYRFEYGISTVYHAKTELQDAGSGSGEEHVSPAEISGLQAGRTYHYRIVATNSYGKTRGPDETFLVPTNPRISGIRATELSETSAVLNARIDPVSAPTTYHFEYGRTPSYEVSTPEQELGSTSEIQAVSDHLIGLQPGITYHFRVVATNEWGTSQTADSNFSFRPPACPNNHVRQQTNASYLPDCRAYELVSPGTAGSVTFFSGDVTHGNFFAELLRTHAPNASGLASSPPRFGFFGSMGSVIGSEPPNALLDRYVATRTTSGWKTTFPGMKGNEGLVVLNPQCNFSLSECVDTSVNPFAENEFPNVRNLWNISGEYEGTLPTNLAAVPHGSEFKGETQLSGDFTHFVFSSRNVPFAPGGLEQAPGSVYDNTVRDGSVTLISKLQNGDPIPQDAGQSNESIKIPYVSEDGSHILLSTIGQDGTEDMYLIVDDAITYGLGSGHFVGATSDGTTFAFTSPNELLAEDADNSVDMYEWREAASPHLLLVSQGNGNGNADSCSDTFGLGCDVKPVSSLRPDLDNSVAAESGDVYFYSPEQLDAESPGVRNERNLYVYHRGQVKYVTTFDPETQADRINVSPDGEHMAFLSRTEATGYVNVSLDDGMPKDSHEPQAWEEMYTYSSNSGELLCASCIPSGAPPTIATLDIGSEPVRTNKDVAASQSGRFMSNDGRVAFAAADALVPTDTNRLIDVYEFTDDRPQLITSGSSDRDTQGGGLFNPTVHTGLESFSQSGTDLYFSTFETLVPEDLNGPFLKFYDARTNGGFPVESPKLPCTAADECHGDSTSAPSDPSFATTAGLGPRQASSHAHSTKRKAKKSRRSRKARKRHAHRNAEGGRHG
jgi:hypothetical protein